MKMETMDPEDLFCAKFRSILITNKNPVTIAFPANCVLRVDDVDMT